MGDRPPCMCAPYHYRLDWNIWFLGFKPHRKYLEKRETWMWSFLEKILDADEMVLSLLAPETSRSSAFRSGNASEGLRRPIFAKVDMWRYRMRAPLWTILYEYVTHGRAVWWT